MESIEDAVLPTVSLCRDPSLLFHPTRYRRQCVEDRIRELVRATYALQWRHKAIELQHAPECHQTAMCVLGFDHPLASLMEDNVDPSVRSQTIALLAPPNMTSPLPSHISTPWMNALSMLCCEVGKPREMEKFVEALFRSPELQTEHGTIWVMWLCLLSCLVFPLDANNPITRSVMDTLTCTLANKTTPTVGFSPIEECVLTIMLMASTGDVIPSLRPWSGINVRHDQDLRLRALIENISGKIVVGGKDCTCREDAQEETEILT